LTISPQRGDVVRVRLDPIVGSEQGGIRPVLVLSPDVINHNAPVVLIACITSKKTERIYRFEALIEPPEGGLTRRSKIMLMQLRSIDKQRILGRMGRISEETMRQVEQALLVAAGMVPT
jgi:mRNA interferase MazF